MLIDGRTRRDPTGRYVVAVLVVLLAVLVVRRMLRRF